MLLKPKCGFMNTWLINDELAPEKDVTKYNDNHEIVKISIFSQKRQPPVGRLSLLADVRAGFELCPKAPAGLS